MPKIVVSGISKEIMACAAPRLMTGVSEALMCPQEWISIELVSSLYFDCSGETKHDPMIEIYWFKRSPEVGKRVAGLISDELFKLGIRRVIIQVIDTSQENYFDMLRSNE